MATSPNLDTICPLYPHLPSFSGLDNTSSQSQRVTMKTRVAIRDNTPHRFEVVELCEAEHRTRPSTHQDISPLTRHGAKPFSEESLAFSSNSACPSTETKRLAAEPDISSPNQHNDRLFFKQTPSLKITPKRRNCSVLSATPLESFPSTPSRSSKSTSLSGLSAGDTPQSAEHPRRGMTPSPNSHWRQAIYAQSLSVPTLDFLSEPPSFSSSSPSPNPKRQSLKPSPLTDSSCEDSRTLANDAFELVVPFPSPTSFSPPTCPLRNVPLRSRSASLARKSQDPASVIGDDPMKPDVQHGIISELLVAVDGVLEEWKFSNDSG